MQKPTKISPPETHSNTLQRKIHDDENLITPGHAPRTQPHKVPHIIPYDTDIIQKAPHHF